MAPDRFESEPLRSRGRISKFIIASVSALAALSLPRNDLTYHLNGLVFASVSRLPNTDQDVINWIFVFPDRTMSACVMCCVMWRWVFQEMPYGKVPIWCDRVCMCYRAWGGIVLFCVIILLGKGAYNIWMLFGFFCSVIYYWMWFYQNEKSNDSSVQYFRIIVIIIHNLWSFLNNDCFRIPYYCFI